jgi:hypothetical protein
MSHATREEPAVVVGKAYDFTLWLLPKTEKFARSYSLGIGDGLAGCKAARRTDQVQ